MLKSCCDIHIKRESKCVRTKDNKIFKLPRKFSKITCLTKNKPEKYCAPYKYCHKSFDVYLNQNPSDTISIQYKTLLDVKNTIKKLEILYKRNKYTHKRIWQVAMILMVRLRVLKEKKMKSYKLSKKYLDFLKNRTKIKLNADRKKIVFNPNKLCL